GNAIPEALVFGDVAGRNAANFAATRQMPDELHDASAAAVGQIRVLADGRDGDVAAPELLNELRDLMWRDVGPFRTASGLSVAIGGLEGMRAALPNIGIPAGRQFNAALADWFELRGSLTAAMAVANAAAARTESRGAHQRDDFPDTDPAWARSQRITMTA